ncbi:hypothetical protein EB001_21275 [bacterium]|nr:hypothetical protein [bacterium]
MIKEKLTILWRRIVEATSSCLIMMTQGNVLAITIGHWITALKTGFLTGIMAIAVAIFGNKEMQENKYVVAGITGFLTAIADLFVHPSHYGGVHTEAVITGIGAGLLCIALSNIGKK